MQFYHVERVSTKKQNASAAEELQPGTSVQAWLWHVIHTRFWWQTEQQLLPVGQLPPSDRRRHKPTYNTWHKPSDNQDCVYGLLADLSKKCQVLQKREVLYEQQSILYRFIKSLGFIYMHKNSLFPHTYNTIQFSNLYCQTIHAIDICLLNALTLLVIGDRNGIIGMASGL